MQEISRPSYRREDLAVGIVHFGVGNFHRAHQARYLDRLFEQGLARDWAICGVGVLPGDVRMRDALSSRDFRYTLVERDPDGTARAREIGSIVDYRYAPDDPEAVLELLADPAVRIVTLTVTEGGYNIDEASGRFDLAEPSVVADLVDGAVPRTVFGLVAEGLRRRRDRGIAPFTVASCDNLPGNGEIARRALVSFATAKDARLGEWIAAEVAFPSGMVDRITPVTGDDERRFAAEEFGATDPWPVVSEGFRQWVLEDRFPAGRPPLEEVGVQLVEDVMPYERMKLRLLNASHQALAYPGLLTGHRFAHEAATDPLIAALVRALMRDEAEPTLGTVPGVDLAGYQEELLRRFANPYVRDTLLRLATDGADRIATFVLPIARDRIAAGASVGLCAAVAASWAVLAVRGADEAGEPVRAGDRQAGLVAEVVARAAGDPAAIVGDERLFGDLAAPGPFADSVVRTYRAIESLGVRRALEELLGI